MLTTVEATAARRNVYIYKQYDYTSTVPVRVVPVVGVVFDIARRTSCDPRVAVGTGPGDPGFDPNGPKVGNFLVPAIYRSQCGGVRPKWYGW